MTQSKFTQQSINVVKNMKTQRTVREMQGSQGKFIEMTAEVLSAQASRKSKVKPLRHGDKNKRRDKPTRTQ
jgi:hypothetical protein